MSNPTASKYLQEQQECEDFISTLPKRKSYTVNPLHQYEGFWYNKRHLVGVILSQKHFEAQHSDVFVATNPKCGTTWLKAITFALLHRKRHTSTSKDHPLLSSNPHDLVPYLDMTLYSGNEIPDMESFPSPRLLATHMPYAALPESIKRRSKLVYICRDPKDAFVSHWEFAIKTGFRDARSTMEDAFGCFCEGLSHYGPFWDHVLGYWEQSVANPERILFLRYEAVKAQPAIHISRVAEFLGCPFSEEEEEEGGVVDRLLDLCSFDHLRGLEVNKTGRSAVGVDNSALFRRGQVGDWKNYLSPQMLHKIDQITRNKFSATGLVI